MIAHAYRLTFLGALSLMASPIWADDVDFRPPLDEQAERIAGFVVTEQESERDKESAGIFAPLSPITVESEPVKLPEDQRLER